MASMKNYSTLKPVSMFILAPDCYLQTDLDNVKLSFNISYTEPIARYQVLL